MVHPANTPLPPQPGGRRVTTIGLTVEALESGRVRISSPHARGFAATAGTPMELAQAVARAFTEVACASYALAKGSPYDLDQMTTHVPGDPLAANPQRRVRGRRTVRAKAYDAAAWTKYEDGSWRSPSGRQYREDTTAVQNVIRKRRERGLPT